jgi:integrase/recombinase XerD
LEKTSRRSEKTLLLSDACTDFLIAKDLSESSRVWYRRQLRRFIEWLPVTNVEDITRQHLRQYGAWLRTLGIKSVTQHGYMTAAKAFLNWLAHEDAIDSRVTMHVEMPKVEQKIVQTLSPAHISALVNAARSQECKATAERDAAIVLLLLDGGMRANELCNLTLDNIDIEQGYVRIVNAKGRKQRELGIGRECRRALGRYIHRYRPQTDDPHVFISHRTGEGLVYGGLWHTLRRLSRMAGLPDGTVRPHILRHSWSASALKAGMDVVRISRLLGHESLATTETYIRSFDSKQARDGAISVGDIFFSKG